MDKSEMRALSIKRSPEQMAAGLHHLHGFLWLDTAGNMRADEDSTISIIAANPLEERSGNLRDEDVLNELRAVLAANRHAAPAPLGSMPNGGWFGSIDYDGTFHFGLYPEVLVYYHHGQSWFEQGELSTLWRQATEENRPIVGKFEEDLPKVEFQEIVETIQEYIRAGDLYQVNLCHRFEAEILRQGDLFRLYNELRRCSPAPMAAFLRQAKREVLSSSPELFLKFSGDRVMTRPIKGTRPRFTDPMQDQQSAYELRTSEKEIAELVMITDLMRNDIGQVCEFGKVEVTEMLKLETYEQVYHLVSTIKGQLSKDCDALDCLAACFPGGSITGAPKKRSMEIIDEIEAEPRGLYTGSIGYLGFNGESQFNIVIRTLIAEEGKLHFHVGAGIVADSSPTAEYEETLHKASGMIEAAARFSSSG